MTRVVLPASLRPFTGGETELDLDVADIRQLFNQLGDRFPALKPHLEDGLAVAIDDQIYQDTLTEPIPPGAEVYLVPKIAGGRTP